MKKEKKKLKVRMKEWYERNKEKLIFLSGVALGGVTVNSMWKAVRNFESHKSTEEGHTLSLSDIDDEELIDLYMDDPEFREEYNVTEEEYTAWKNRQEDLKELEELEEEYPE